MLPAIASYCHRTNLYIGRLIAWMALMMVLMMSVNVSMRYLFSAGEPWQQELVRFMHAGLFLLGAGYALGQGAHVRVDVFYQRASERTRHGIDLFGTLFLLLPFCGALLYVSYEYVISSWAIWEGSSEYNGMPGVFLLKSGIWGCAAVLILQAVAVIAESCAALTSKHDG